MGNKHHTACKKKKKTEDEKSIDAITEKLS